MGVIPISDAPLAKTVDGKMYTTLAGNLVRWGGKHGWEAQPYKTRTTSTSACTTTTIIHGRDL